VPFSMPLASVPTMPTKLSCRNAPSPGR
jgi:hypothetical protein